MAWFGVVVMLILAIQLLNAGVREAEASSHCTNVNLNGTGGEDYLVASSGQNNVIRGFDSADYIRGDDCVDELHGGQGPDNVHGAHGDDHVLGEDGNDNPNNCNSIFTYCGELVGGAGEDWIQGGINWDFIDDTYGPDGQDLAEGNDGDDTLKVNDGDLDDGADGGAGTDQCTADAASEKTSC